MSSSFLAGCRDEIPILKLLVGVRPEELDKFLKGEIDRWAKVVRDNKIAIGD